MCISEDGCQKSTDPTCHALGFKRVITPGPFGVYSRADAELLLNTLNYDSDLYQNMTDQCKRSVLALQCGMYAPKCQNGKPTPICRDHCEGMSFCIVRENNSHNKVDLIAPALQ